MKNKKLNIIIVVILIITTFAFSVSSVWGATFGNESTSGNEWSGADEMHGTQYNLPEDGDLSGCSAYPGSHSSDAVVKYGVYDSGLNFVGSY